MNYLHTNNQKGLSAQTGFTLVETLVAVFILTLSIGALLSLAAGGFYSVKYARNQIVATNLMQESLEYIRNSRDTALQKGMTWDEWKDSLSVDTEGVLVPGQTAGCFSDDGCYVNPYVGSKAPIKQCGASSCPYVLYYPDNTFYGYSTTSYPFVPVNPPYQTSFVRTITIAPAGNPDQLEVTEVVTWLNGSNQKTISQSMLITNWKP
jgi:type II secretory pathway pseudopilin PulG